MEHTPTQTRDTAKVHVAGSPDGLIQRCTRCHAKITDNAKLPASLQSCFWRTGVLVASSRHGMSVITEEQSAQFRACGRSK